MSGVVVNGVLLTASRLYFVDFPLVVTSSAAVCWEA